MDAHTRFRWKLHFWVRQKTTAVLGIMDRDFGIVIDRQLCFVIRDIKPGHVLIKAIFPLVHSVLSRGLQSMDIEQYTRYALDSDLTNDATGQVQRNAQL